MGTLFFLTSVFLFFVSASPLSGPDISYRARDTRDPYVPKTNACNGCPPLRSAPQVGDLSPAEQTYVTARKPIADTSLRAWFASVEKEMTQRFDLNVSRMPTLSMATSGGADRAFLTGAGVVQAFDIREQQKTDMSGLYQSLSYHSALSGGNEMLGSLERLNWPTISYIADTLWDHTFTHGRLFPGGTAGNSTPIYAQIIAEINAKKKAGFRVSIVDFFGRLYGYSFLGPTAGSVGFKYSDIPGLSRFVSHQVPFGIHMSTQAAEYGENAVIKGINNTQFELTPYEFGSWDPGVAYFSQMKYLGSTPSDPNLYCVTGFDDMGFIMATSGDSEGLLNLTAAEGMTRMQSLIQKSTKGAFNFTQEDLEALVPNPFFHNPGSPAISEFPYLQMVDGGGAGMGVAVWPLIHRPEIDIIFVVDSTDNSNGMTNGTDLHNTYVEAQRQGLVRMPPIPPVSTFDAASYNKRNVFFGCNTPNTASIVYMPLVDYTYNSTGIKTSLTSTLSASQVNAAIGNGNYVATFNNKAGWAQCVACLIMKKTETVLPPQCASCFAEYCVN